MANKSAISEPPVNAEIEERRAKFSVRAVNTGTTIGHNGGPALDPSPRLTPEQRAEREKLLRDQITHYISYRRIADSLEQEELAQLEGIERYLTLHKGLIFSLIDQSRLNPNMSPAPAVMALITALSDNNAGICTLTTVRMAQLLGRQDGRSIRRAIEQLESQGLIRVNRNRGLPSSYSPVIPAFIVQQAPSVFDFVAALSDKPAPRGRPEKTPAAPSGVYCEPEKTPAPLSGVIEKTPAPLSGVIGKTPALPCKNPGGSVHSTSSKGQQLKGSEVSGGAFVSEPQPAEQATAYNSDADASSPPTDEDVSSFGAWVDPDALNGEIVDLEPVEDGQEFGAGKGKSAKRSRSTGARKSSDGKTSWDTSNFDFPRLFQYAEGLGLSKEEMRSEHDKFEFWCSENPSRGRYRDWNRAWENWVAKAANEFRTVGPNKRQNGSGPRGRMSIDEVAEASAQMASAKKWTVT